MVESLVVLRYWFSSVVALAVATSADAQPEHVVLISIDGLAAYHLDNDELELPNLRELIAAGVWAESSETVFPSVTHPAHTTLVTGVPPAVHGVIGNRMVNRETGEEFHITNKPHSESVRVRTLFDAAKDKGLTTAAFFWPESLDDPAIDYNIPEVFDGDAADPRPTDPAFLDELRRADVPIDLFFRWYTDIFRVGAGDGVLVDAAAYVIRTHRPELVAIHLVATDEIQHAYGSDHYRSYEALTLADNAVGVLRVAIDAAGLGQKTAFLIVADHGFHTVRHEVNVAPVFERHALADRVRLHRDGWFVYVEVLDPARDEAALAAVFDELLELEGIARILRPADYDALGYPRYEQDPRVRGHYAIAGDIDTFPVADSSNVSTARREREPAYHGHGYLPSHPRMYPAFIASGAGIREGLRVGHVRNLDVAPTVARLLGLELPSATGAVMEKILVETPR
jgi:predicted AlkP superfamily pyrophosphatase or phosphodiesterase